MANGDDPMWKAIEKLRDDHKNLARDGCGHKIWHEKIADELRDDLTAERKDREHMGEFIVKEMKEMKEGLLLDSKAIRNQIFLGMCVLMALTLVIDKVLK